MPRHEIVVNRIPDEFQGKRVRLPVPDEMHHFYTRTVADYRASNAPLRHQCPTCDLTFDMSSLEPVFDAWGPDVVITVSLSCHWVPGEPRRKPGSMPNFFRDKAKGLRGPGIAGTEEGPATETCQE